MSDLYRWRVIALCFMLSSLLLAGMLLYLADRGYCRAL